MLYKKSCIRENPTAELRESRFQLEVAFTRVVYKLLQIGFHI